MDIVGLLDDFSWERPVGTPSNNAIAARLADMAEAMGYGVTALPFPCKTWCHGDSALKTGSQVLPVLPGPFTSACTGTGEMIFVETLPELRQSELSGKIVVLKGEIAGEPIMPKDYPFYYPDEHREINELLEAKKPLAILAITGKHPMCGLNPFPLFNDIRFEIPHSYASAESLAHLMEGCTASISIVSTVADATSRQIIARSGPSSESRGRIIVCAHMDTDYDTPGALDNAVGLVALVGVMEKMKNWTGPFALEFVPFNGEDYCEASGQIAYIEHNHNDFGDVRLCINIDDAGLRGALNAVSRYNLPDAYSTTIDDVLRGNATMTRGEEWYASDHTLFAMRGVPSIAIASSELMGETIQVTHTPYDTPDKVDVKLVEGMIDFITGVIKRI